MVCCICTKINTAVMRLFSGLKWRQRTLHPPVTTKVCGRGTLKMTAFHTDNSHFTCLTTWPAPALWLRSFIRCPHTSFCDEERTNLHLVEFFANKSQTFQMFIYLKNKTWNFLFVETFGVRNINVMKKQQIKLHTLYVKAYNYCCAKHLELVLVWYVSLNINTLTVNWTIL